MDNALHGANLFCLNGVCVLAGSVECSRHSDCTAGNLCSGRGWCVQSRLELVNRGGADVEWHVLADSC
eukprot:220329-Rhodomonas_salina.1